MKPTKKKDKKSPIVQYLHDNLGYYINPFAVHFNLEEDATLNITAAWPDPYPGVECRLEVCWEGTTVEEFSQLTGIKSVEQLHFVSPPLLVDLYHKGIAALWVTVEAGELYYELLFRKKGDKLYMLDEEEEVVREVGRKLETPVDFFKYTRNYAKKL